MTTETTTEINEGDRLTTFLDKIWLQAGIATGITVLWIFWIIFEILIKPTPA